MPARRVDPVHVVGIIDAYQRAGDVFEHEVALGLGQDVLQIYMMGTIGGFRPGTHAVEFAVDPDDVHAVQSEVLLDLQREQFLQFPYIFYSLDHEVHGITSLCDRSERDAHIRFRLPNGTVLGRPPALTVGYDHLSVHVFKRAKSDIAVLQQFSDRND